MSCLAFYTVFLFGERDVTTVDVGSLKTLFVNGLVSLINGISTLFRLFNAKAILLEEQ